MVTKIRRAAPPGVGGGMAASERGQDYPRKKGNNSDCGDVRQLWGGSWVGRQRDGVAAGGGGGLEEG
jgi:hypothetical protein